MGLEFVQEKEQTFYFRTYMKYKGQCVFRVIWILIYKDLPGYLVHC